MKRLILKGKMLHKQKNLNSKWLWFLNKLYIADRYLGWFLQ